MRQSRANSSLSLRSDNPTIFDGGVCSAGLRRIVRDYIASAIDRAKPILERRIVEHLE
jgi:hypothetical protein